ncbi:MAG: IS1634 family transposase [Desulfobacterales bacterium]|nr:IS1634 family transposase [Desulfobacterales bacterium]
MYVDVSTIRAHGKSYTRYLLRENYREDGKVKHRTVANLSPCSAEEIEAIRLALKHKAQLAQLIEQDSVEAKASTPRASQHGEPVVEVAARAKTAVADAVDSSLVQLRQGKPIGAVWLLAQLARELGITQALGDDAPGRLALWQVLARTIDQGSRLSAVRLASSYACGFLGLPRFSEDELYSNLDWLEAQHAQIEQALFARRAQPEAGSGADGLFLYDVTSSYLEGQCNELAAFGYNRDGKKGKRQVVIGLLCDAAGVPLAIEVFAGNTQDPKTVDSQIKKLAARFGAKAVTFVGDRGMIKSAQMQALAERGWSYITAITKPQIERLLKSEVLQMSLFDDGLAEVIDQQTNERYVLRRNPVRQAELAATHASKCARVQAMMDKENKYLAEHGRAKAQLALARVRHHAKRLGVEAWLSVALTGRVLSMTEDAAVKDEHTKLDGCYVIKTNLTPAQAPKEVVHDRYKDLAQVEWAFRSAKSLLEMRPIYVRLAAHTRAHALVVMLAYRLIQELAKRWRALDITVQEGLCQLNTLCVHELSVDGRNVTRCIPTPNAQVLQLFEHAAIGLPTPTQAQEPKVSTKTKLPSRRK